MSTEMWALIALWDTVEPTVSLALTEGEAWQNMARHLDNISAAADNHPEGFAVFAAAHPFDPDTATGEQAQTWAMAYAKTFEDDPALELVPVVPCGDLRAMRPAPAVGSITDLFDEDKLERLARTAAEVVNEFDHGDLLAFLVEQQIEVAQEAYRELIEREMTSDAVTSKLVMSGALRAAAAHVRTGRAPLHHELWKPTAASLEAAAVKVDEYVTEDDLGGLLCDSYGNWITPDEDSCDCYTHALAMARMINRLIHDASKKAGE